MQIHELLLHSVGKKKRMRVGRGIGSGNGKTCGRGHKGAASRSGHSSRLSFEGGQTAMFRRTAKRGHSNAAFADRPQLIRLSDLQKIGAVSGYVNTDELHRSGLISRDRMLYKIVDCGDVIGPLNLVVKAISKGAARRVVEMGGTVVIDLY